MEVIGHDRVGEDAKAAIAGDLPELFAEDLLGRVIKEKGPVHRAGHAVIDGTPVVVEALIRAVRAEGKGGGRGRKGGRGDQTGRIRFVRSSIFNLSLILPPNSAPCPQLN